MRERLSWLLVGHDEWRMNVRVALSSIATFGEVDARGARG